MAFREVTVIETMEVLRLWRSGVAKKRIAAQLGVDVKTVRGYLKVAEKLGLDPALDLDQATAAVVERLAAANRRPRGRAWELCGEHADYIRSKLEHGVRLTKVRKLLLRQRQVRVSCMTLYRYAVEELGFERRAATFPVMGSNSLLAHEFEPIAAHGAINDATQRGNGFRWGQLGESSTDSRVRPRTDVDRCWNRARSFGGCRPRGRLEVVGRQG